MPTYIMPDSELGPSGYEHHPLEVFFSPKTIAVFGASEAPESVGRAVMANLIRCPCSATLFPINPKRPGVLGIKAYPSLNAVPLPVDLAIVATPAPTVPDIIGDCAAAGVKGAILISSGFQKEVSGNGLERKIAEHLRHSSLRVLGPSSLGVVCPRTGINATFAPAPMVRRGSVGFLSQSGSLLAALQSAEVPDSVGCSSFISLGSMLDLGWVDWLAYLGEDPQTELIGIYAETLGDPRAFFRAVRQVTSQKPVILVKGGRTSWAARRTEALASQDEVFEDLFRRAGVLRVETVTDLLRMADLVGRQQAPQGRRLTIVSNSGGPAVLAADALVANGGELSTLAPATVAALHGLLPTWCYPRNPIDVGDDADAERYARAAVLATHDPHCDALLLILTPQTTINPLKTAEQVSRLALTSGGPILACWMWGAAMPTCLAVLKQAGIPTFLNPNDAIRALGYLWRHEENLQGLSETVSQFSTGVGAREPALAGRIVAEARQTGRTLLTEEESRQLLAMYSLPALGNCVAANPAEAVEMATALGYPVVLEPFTDGEPPRVGVVRVHAGNETAVRWSFRKLRMLSRDRYDVRQFKGVRIGPAASPHRCVVRLHSRLDPQVGPVLGFSVGGPWTAGPTGELLTLPPLTAAKARQLLASSSLGTVLQALPGGQRPLAALEQFLVRFSWLLAEQHGIQEICMEAVLASGQRVLAVDPRMILHGQDVREEHLPRPVVRCDPTQGAIVVGPSPHASGACGVAVNLQEVKMAVVDPGLDDWHFSD
jgi:acetyltransferase